MKDELCELKKYLEELKTISFREVPKEEILKDQIVEIKDGKYVLVDDIIDGEDKYIQEKIPTDKIIQLSGGKFIPVTAINKHQFISTKKYICTLNNGEEIPREKLQKAGRDGSAVLVIPVTEDNKVIVTVEPRVFTKRTTCVGFPAGYIEEGEAAADSALRELQEEVGCVPKYLIELSRFYQDEGISSAKNVAYLALGCKEGYEKDPDPGEFIKYIKCDFNDVLDLEKEGYIEGSNSIIAIAKAKPYFSSRGKVKKLKLYFDKKKIDVER